MTPFEQHEALNHKVTFYSPNGVDKVEECSDCPVRFIHNPAIGYPVSLPFRERNRADFVLKGEL